MALHCASSSCGTLLVACVVAILIAHGGVLTVREVAMLVPPCVVAVFVAVH